MQFVTRASPALQPNQMQINQMGHCFRDDIRLSRDVVLLICRNRIIVFLHARPLIFPRLNQAEDDIASIWPHAASTHSPR
jgi:hypothetical protein